MFSSINTLFRDVLTNILALILLVLIVVLFYLNPKSKLEEGFSTLGYLVFESTWNSQYDCDVDLWVAEPDNPVPVGYSNHISGELAYLRDDVGFLNDLSGINHEVVFSRTPLPGRYIVNLYLYKLNNCPTPIEVYVKVYRKTAKASFLIHESTNLLEFQTQQITVVSFELDKEGYVKKGSVNSDFYNLFKNRN